MLVTLGASTVVQDNFHGNTALHWAIIARNSTAVTTLAINGANLGVRNNAVSILRVIAVIIQCWLTLHYFSLLVFYRAKPLMNYLKVTEICSLVIRSWKR